MMDRNHFVNGNDVCKKLLGWLYKESRTHQFVEVAQYVVIKSRKCFPKRSILPDSPCSSSSSSSSSLEGILHHRSTRVQARRSVSRLPPHLILFLVISPTQASSPPVMPVPMLLPPPSVIRIIQLASDLALGPPYRLLRVQQGINKSSTPLLSR